MVLGWNIVAKAAELDRRMAWSINKTMPVENMIDSLLCYICISNIMGTFSICLKRGLKFSTKDKKLNLMVIGAFSSVLLLLAPTSAAFAQTPWGLFQRLCPSGSLKTF
jgi:hypothetical protein